MICRGLFPSPVTSDGNRRRIGTTGEHSCKRWVLAVKPVIVDKTSPAAGDNREVSTNHGVQTEKARRRRRPCMNIDTTVAPEGKGFNVWWKRIKAQDNHSVSYRERTPSSMISGPVVQQYRHFSTAVVKLKRRYIVAGSNTAL